MSYSYGRTMGGVSMGGGFGPVTSKLVKILIGCYVAQLVLTHWLRLESLALLFLYPLGEGFRPWQLVTHLFLQYPGNPLPFLFELLFFWFFSGALETQLGPRRYLTLFFLAGIGGAALALPFTAIPGLASVFLGLAAVTSGLLTAYCLLFPFQQVYFFFLLPLQMRQLFIVFLIYEVLSLLAKSNPTAVFHLAGAAVAYLYMDTRFRKLRLGGFLGGLSERVRLFWLKSKRRRFRVVTDADEGPGKPLLH